MWERASLDLSFVQTSDSALLRKKPVTRRRRAERWLSFKRREDQEGEKSPASISVHTSRLKTLRAIFTSAVDRLLSKETSAQTPSMAMSWLFLFYLSLRGAVW